ncbi:C39 family peptidase [Bacillus sp. JJ1764]|uniref:C39 family peptidase n=1 Tax=Bacillus sp. JJ1764 TaxID=3122964 RepID=UPI002FFF9540
MKGKILAVLFTIGILVSVSYVQAQKPNLTTKTTNSSDKNTENILEVKEVSNSDATQENEAQNQTKTQVLNQNGKIVISGVAHIQQLPELPRGCEVTSLAMLLQYEGTSVDKMTLAKEINTIPFRDQSGLHGNPNVGFVGDMYSFDHPGYGVYHTPIANLAEKYLPGRIIDLTGEDIDSVYNMINQGSPVWVITNSRFTSLPQSEFSAWNTQTGSVQITYREHSVLVVGYDNQYIYINDPLSDQSYKSVPRASFEASWVQMGQQAVSYQL